MIVLLQGVGGGQKGETRSRISAADHGYCCTDQSRHALGRGTAATMPVEGVGSAGHVGPQAPIPKAVHGEIRRRPILGGLINQYEAAA
jgi:hypothetical protein